MEHGKRVSVTGVRSVVSVPRVLEIPAAQPAAASVGARLGMGEDIVRSWSLFSVAGLCDLISPVQIFGSP